MSKVVRYAKSQHRERCVADIRYVHRLRTAGGTDGCTWEGERRRTPGELFDTSGGSVAYIQISSLVERKAECLVAAVEQSLGIGACRDLNDTSVVVRGVQVAGRIDCEAVRGIQIAAARQRGDCEGSGSNLVNRVALKTSCVEVAAGIDSQANDSLG